MGYEEHQPAEQWGDDLFDRSRGMRRAYFIGRAAAAVTQPFRRWWGGRQSPGIAGGLAFLVMPLWAVQTQDPLVFLYWQVWVVALIVYRLAQNRRAHSHYEGYPWLAAMISKRYANEIEPFLILAIGYAVYQLAPGLGLLLMVSGGGIAVNEYSDWFIRRRSVIAYTDSQIEMENQRQAYKRGR